MRFPLSTVAVNVLVLIATNAAFRSWVESRYGHFEPEILGASALVWPVLASAAIVSTWVGFRWRRGRFLAAILVGLLALIVVDNAAGALRDGAVSSEGVVTGVLMGLQCVTLAVGIGLSVAAARVERRRTA